MKKIYLVGAFLFILFMALFFLEYMKILRPEVVFMDSLRGLIYFEQALDDGFFSLLKTWNQGQHRGIIGQIFLYCNAKFFGLKVYEATLLSVIPLSLTCALIVIAQYNSILELNSPDWLKKALFLLISFFTVAGVFSLSNWELYSLDIGVTLFFKNLIFILYWGLLGNLILRNNESSTLKLITIISTPIIVLTIAYGWSFGFVFSTIISLFLYREYINRNKINFIKILSAVLTLSLVAYIFGGILLANDGFKNPKGYYSISFNSIVNIIYAIKLGLTSIFIGGESFNNFKNHELIENLIAILILISFSRIIYTIFVLKIKLPFMLLNIIIYGVINLIIIAIFRGQADPYASMASRYYMDYCLIFIGIIWFWGLDFGRSNVIIKYYIPIIILALYFFGQLITSLDEWKKAPYRHYHFEKMKLITLGGVKNDDEVNFMQSRLAAKGIQVQRKYNLGPFGDLSCLKPVFGAGWINNAPNQYWIEGVSKGFFRNCGEKINFEFYIPSNWPKKDIFILVGSVSYQYRLTPGIIQEVSVPTQDHGDISEITIKVSPVTIPSEVDSNSTDNRKLGLLVVFK